MSDNGTKYIEFGDFRLDTATSHLWQDGQLVNAPPKVIEILVQLATSHGEVVSRETLLDTVWKDTFVEEGNINYTISLLRKTLGHREFIQTIPRRGYRFVGEIKDFATNGNVAAVEAIEKPAARTRWILIGAFVIGLSLVTSFVFLGAKNAEDKLSEARSTNAEAAQAYTRGKMILENRSVEDREQKAIDEFQRAVTLDPTFALAHFGLAEAFSSTAGRQSGEKARDYYAKAKVAVQKGMALEPNSWEGLSINGWLKHQADWDFESAEADLRKAVELDPESALAHLRLSRSLIATSKPDEALAAVIRAYELDPVAEMMMLGRFAILESRGEYDEALRLADESLRENKDSVFAVRALATFLFHKGEYARVIEMTEEALKKGAKLNSFAPISLLAASYYKTGAFEKADELINQLEALSRNDSKALYSLAMNYAETGRHDEAFVALQKCIDVHEERMVWIKVEPRFANLRHDQRFEEILRKVNLK